MRERDIEACFARFARRAGCVAFKFTSPGTAGVPDRLVLTPRGRAFFIEFKAPGKRGNLSPLQRKQIDSIRNFGFEVWVVDRPGEAEEKLSAYLLEDI